MIELPKLGFEDSNYDGSRTFVWLANMCGLSVDLVNFLLSQVLALFLASIFRSLLHPSKVSTEVRHVAGTILGLFFGYFCFGQQAIHIAGLPAICYIVIRTQNPEIVQRTVMIVALVYLSCIHLHRQIYDYGSYSLDITGPLMIITQKVTSLAFSIHDGFTREQEELTKSQQYHAVHKLPSALEYFSYLLHFQGLMAGPMIFYKDYIDFIEGYHILKHPGANNNLDNKYNNSRVYEPSPTKTVIKKVIGSLICAFIFMKFIKMYPIRTLKDDDAFIQDTTIFYKFWYIMMATTVIRFKYYHAWLLADAICNNSGLGFNGYDKDGNPKWDLISNINVLSFEFATNIRDCISNWNIGTNRWLRTVVYERVPKRYGTVLTFALSALWHGFYPGYYVTFATGALLVTGARTARRLFRHRFQKTQFTRMFYDILTCLTTRAFMGYTTFPFVLLEFMASLNLYLKLYMCLHLVAIITIFILPIFIKGEKRSSTKKSTETITLSSTTEINESTKFNKSEIMNSNNSNSDNNNLIKNCDKILINNNNKTINVQNDENLHHNDLAKPKLLTRSEAVRVKHDECEMENLSNKLKEKIDAETRNIEDFIDKTVNGIVELKDDLMRMNGQNTNSDKLLFMKNNDSRLLRKRNLIINNNNNINNLNSNNEKHDNNNKSVDAFLKKEIDAINAAVQQANVLPAVLSNGHAK